MQPDRDRIVAEFLITQVKASHRLIGSHLGFAIKNAFPDLDMKTEYGGLKQFINQYCAGHIALVGKHGADDVYAFVESSHDAPPDLHGPIRPQLVEAMSAAELWKAFSNPNHQMVLAINKLTGDMALVPCETSPPDGFALIDKVSPEEHRAIARGFATQATGALRDELERAVAQADYWRTWSHIVNERGNDSIHVAWMQWRGKKIIELLESRLRLIDIPEEVIRNAVLRVAAYIRLDPSHLFRTHVVLDAPEQTSYSVAELRRILHAAIDMMSEEELRQIRLPLGVMVDVSGRRR